VSPAPEHDAAGSARHGGWWARAALQGLGFLLGIGLLWWCIHTAFSRPETRAELSKLAAARWWDLAAMVAISMLAITLDGLMFRAVLQPVKKLPALTMLSVAGVCSVLSYLPFKASMLFRFVYHTRRDGLPVLTIVAWIIATGTVLLISLLPIAGATIVRPQADAVWWGLIAAATVLAAIIAHGVCRVTMSIGTARSGSLPDDPPPLSTLTWHEKLKDAARMLAQPRALAHARRHRHTIVALQALRFVLAAKLMGVAVSPEQALIAGAAYNLIQAISPGGVAGFREAGAATALSFLNGPDILAVTLTVTAAEAVSNALMGIAGAVYLRIDTLFLRRSASPPLPVQQPAPNSE
jgi:hypothetical protein